MDANNNNNGNNNGQPKMNMPKFNMNWIYFIVIAILIGLYMTGGTDSGQTKKQVPYSKFKDMVDAGSSAFGEIEAGATVGTVPQENTLSKESYWRGR